MPYKHAGKIGDVCMDWMTASIEKAKKDTSRNHVTAFVEKCRVFNQLQTKSGFFLEYEKGSPPFSASTFLFLRRIFWGIIIIYTIEPYP